jgi:hypothetical protein
MLLAAALLAAGVTGCGGGGGQDPAKLLKETFGPNKPVRSGKLAVSLDLTANGLKSLKGPLSLALTGPFQSQGKGHLPKFDLSLSLNTAGTNFTAGAVSTGDKGFLRVQGQTYAVSDQLFGQFKTGYEQASAKAKDKSGVPSFKSLGVNPLDWLKDPKNAGTETVGDAETYHVTAGIDVVRFLDDVNRLLAKAGSLGQSARLPSSLSEAQRRDIERSVKSATLDVWTGKSDKTLRRVRVALSFAVPADVRPRAGGLRDGSLKLDILISDLNVAQTITAPANAKPLSDLGGLLGASGTDTIPAPGPTPAPAAPTTTVPGTSQQYLDCLQKAGSDVAKVQECASLLGK